MRASITPGARHNQVELHPFFTRPALRADAQERGVIVQAWSPIGGVFALVDDATTPDGATSPLDHPIITGLARTHGKSASQIILRWHLQHGIAVIPKSVRPHRIIENRDVFDFELSSEEVARIDALDTGVSAGPDPDTFTADSFVVDIDGQ